MKQTNGRFARANQSVKLRLIGASYGEQKVGKTSFWLSAPGPIYIQSFDYGLEGVVQKFQHEKEIYVREYDWAPVGDELTQEAAIELRDAFVADFDVALAQGRTIVWDKETEVWELFRYAEFGPNDVGVATSAPRNYPALNQRYRYHIRRAYDLGVNFGLIQGVKAKWISKPQPGTGILQPHNTGELARTGFNEIGALVQIDLWHKREQGQFLIDVGGCRQNAELQDQQFTNLTFPEMACLVFPDSRLEDWE